MKINVLFVNYFFFKKHDDYKFFARNNFFLLHDLMRFCKRITLAMNTSQWAFFNEILLVVMNVETNCCENILITCFTSCLEMWDVIWKMRFKFIFCWNYFWRFVFVIMLDHFIVNFSDYLISFLTNDACLFLIIEWRMLILDLSSDVYDEMSLNLTRHFIKFIVSDSSNLTKATHQTWWMKTSFHQIWRKRLIKLDEWKRHFIKFDESDSLNLMTSFHQIFEKKDTFFIFWWVVFCNDIWYEELIFAENHRFMRR
jgi:hypothetical protein